MLNICFNKGEELDIIFNNSKSFLFKIGPTYDCCIQNLKLDAADIVWIREIKYLGVNFCSGKIYVLICPVECVNIMLLLIL